MGCKTSKPINDIDDIDKLYHLIYKKNHDVILEKHKFYVKIKINNNFYLIDFNILNKLYEIYIVDRNNIVYSNKNINKIYNWIKKNIL